MDVSRRFVIGGIGAMAACGAAVPSQARGVRVDAIQVMNLP